MSSRRLTGPQRTLLTALADEPDGAATVNEYRSAGMVAICGLHYARALVVDTLVDRGLLTWAGSRIALTETGRAAVTR